MPSGQAKATTRIPVSQSNEGTFNPQMANVQGHCDIAYNVNESAFTDAMFDEFVGDVANAPAPYVDGVLINETIQTR